MRYTFYQHIKPSGLNWDDQKQPYGSVQMKSILVKCFGKIVIAGAICMAVGFVAGCAVSKVGPDQTTLWHQRVTGAYDTGNGKVFFGIGRAAPLQNRSLQRVSADNQARLEMARLLARYSKALAQKASPADGGTPARSEALAPALKALVHRAMQRAIVTDHWADPQQGRLLALCQLTLADFSAVLKDHRGLRTDMRAAMQANLEIVHVQLSQRLLKNQ